VEGTTASLAKAREADAEGERRAAASGKAYKSTAPKVEEDLDAARKRLDTLRGLLVESADDLLAEAVRHLPEATERAEAALAANLDEARTALLVARDALDAAGEAAGERGWIAGLAESGHAFPWRGIVARPVPRAAQAVDAALLHFDQDLREAKERREKATRERERAEAEKYPPGQLVWKAGAEYRADEEGRLVEVPREAEEATR
jgi:hypothetical protein